MSEKAATFQLNSKEVFEALGMNISGISEDRQDRIATFLSLSAHYLKNALNDHEQGLSIESKLADVLSLTSDQASKISEPFHQILQDEGKENILIESNTSIVKKNKKNKKKKEKKKISKIESDESSSNSNSDSSSKSNSESESKSDSSSSSDEKSSSSSDSDDYISIAQKQVPKEGRISKRQGKFMKIPFNLTGATGVTQVGNVVTISTSAQNSIFLNKIFNSGVWRIYFQIISGDASYSAIGVAESSFSEFDNYMGFSRKGMHLASSGGIIQNNIRTEGNQSYSVNDIIGFEIDMITHRIYFFHTFQQQPSCLINTPASLKVGITYGRSNDTQYKVVAIYKLKKPLAIASKSPTIEEWSS
ncbi:MAG: hypothetical protein EZS28_010538 [Streblomastix strix]|uniref:B30.2/SPRY domain-containing protein n=1 Tax=Streblomastix strix TaxID=222440 RepID=A0A5J4WH92_9EUKA|nr:MAG: hypothetical protein EZS28_010538 [Streblomastix strix]